VVYRGIESHIDSHPFLYGHGASLKERVPSLSTRKDMSSPFTKANNEHYVVVKHLGAGLSA